MIEVLRSAFAEALPAINTIQTLENKVLQVFPLFAVH
jgi:hypothetical protein